MKHIFLAIILLTLSGVRASAQKPKFNKEEFRAHQEAFITAQASLTTQEAKQFFPLFFELQDKKENYNREAWDKIKTAKGGELTETEYMQIVESTIQSRINADKLDLEYVKKYKKFLSAKKIFDIQRAETRFHRELLKPRPPKRQ